MKLCYYKEHYLLDEETPFPRDNVRNCFTDDHFNDHIGMRTEMKNGKRYWRTTNDRGKLPSYKLLEALFEENAFDPYTYEELMDVPQLDLKRDINDVGLEWNGKSCFLNAWRLEQDKHKPNTSKEAKPVLW